MKDTDKHRELPPPLHISFLTSGHGQSEFDLRGQTGAGSQLISPFFFFSLHSKLLAQSPASEPPGPKLVGLKEEEKKSEQCFIHPCEGEDAGEELSSPVSCSHLQLPLMSRVDSLQAPHFGPKGGQIGRVTLTRDVGQVAKGTVPWCHPPLLHCTCQEGWFASPQRSHQQDLW